MRTQSLKSLALNPRQERILLSLKKLSFLTRTQLSRIHTLGGKRNTNRILVQLDSYLNSFRDGYDTVYYLNREGREYVDAKRKLRRNQFVTHTIMRNHFFIFKGKPSYWRNEIKVGDASETLTCDTLFKVDEKMYILEVDHFQKMSVNREKIKTYKSISTRVDLPTVIFLTGTEHRRKQLSKACMDAELTHVIYTLEDIL